MMTALKAAAYCLALWAFLAIGLQSTAEYFALFWANVVRGDPLTICAIGALVLAGALELYDRHREG